MTDKKDNPKSLESAVKKWIKRKTAYETLSKNVPDSSVENLFKLLVYNIRLAIPKLKRWRALKNFKRVLKKENENIDKLLNASNKIEKKANWKKEKRLLIIWKKEYTTGPNPSGRPA